ncbi:MAG: telomere resolvase [Brasilonema angustatum HA4187-MV1]|jgi:hypothetical protein|nr:telomere resolvase [Brasilonema angustatum HA4187-MV1]
MNTTHTREEIENANKRTLDEIAKNMGVKGYSRTPKEDLQKKLLTMLEEESEPIQEEKAEPVVFFEKVSTMTDVAEVEQACTELVETLKLNGLQPKSRSNKLSSYSKLFKTLQPTPDTAHLFFPFRAEGKSEYIQRHLFFKFTGLADISWKEANEDIKERRQERQVKSSSRDELADALDAPNKVFNLDLYLKTTLQLLNSKDSYELAVGLIAASGRRPSEIVMLSEFEISDWIPPYIKNAQYGVKVIGLAKKRDKEVTTYTSLLVPTSDFVNRVKYFRSLPEIKAYQDKFQKLLDLGWDKESTWKKIEEQAGYELRKVTELYFDFLPKIDEGYNRKNILLRACTTKILTLRDYPNATSKAKITYAGVLAGHIIPEFKGEKVTYHGETSASTLHYDDYEPDSTEIHFLTIEPKTTTVIKETEDMVRIAELETIIAQLNAQIAEKDALIVEKTQRITELEERINRPRLPQMEVKEMDSDRLFKTRKEGSAEEKLNRAWQAVTAYNDNTPEYKINPTNKVLRELTGVNGQTVTKWMELHKDEVVTHQSKHSLDPDGKGYYNNRYRNKTDMNVEIILETIKKDYLKQL